MVCFSVQQCGSAVASFAAKHLSLVLTRADHSNARWFVWWSYKVPFQSDHFAENVCQVCASPQKCSDSKSEVETFFMILMRWTEAERQRWTRVRREGRTFSHSAIRSLRIQPYHIASSGLYFLTAHHPSFTKQIIIHGANRNSHTRQSDLPWLDTK